MDKQSRKADSYKTGALGKKENPLSQNLRAMDRLTNLRKSLRAKVTLGVTLPILIALLITTLVDYRRDRQLFEHQIQLTAERLGEVTRGSLRHAMLVNDRELLSEIISDVGAMEEVNQVQIINLSGQVKATSDPTNLGVIHSQDGAGCEECHTLDNPPRTSYLSSGVDVMRISTPIVNEPACATCHTEQTAHLGVLLVDISFLDLDRQLQRDLQWNLALSVGTTLLFTFGFFFLIHFLIVRRVEAFRTPMEEYAFGDFSSRLPEPHYAEDEIGDLAKTFNHMADELERHNREREERSQLRQRAIIEERERLARELHDGLAQLLGYINTKVMAIRLLLTKKQLDEVDDQLFQLEEVARGLFVETREAIIGLKMSGSVNGQLASTLRNFTEQFSQLAILPVDLAISPDIDNLVLPVETELQLLRIVQEGLTNIRKHAQATGAWVSLQLRNQDLELIVGDNGIGFDPEHTRKDGQTRFGLAIMKERAEAIGARLDLDSEPEAGTRVIVQLPLKEK